MLRRLEPCGLACTQEAAQADKMLRGAVRHAPRTIGIDPAADTVSQI